ncbi:deoxyguanosinetriphosphate triphosphohydrolase [Ruminococcus flavefaciens]|uniref:deoxyguanosinetriphosphate triphosphohydrolase n=1 Tax=Ruminococcus flavefaciens TaxID=1265 RepID=UPI0026EE081E|nr:deoxyguanosinetriphosphate triphosphohydrolase [Ruminococcus flavefaciens]MDD7517694.1 deoxyguanosinetriphosphate triphosphohydrolase [Ruminococcus flavefaciens]MDY5690495.1 deoxyguanosinetriphosphate triphosphohydrolase [Ruminococcus flavefaciens]
MNWKQLLCEKRRRSYSTTSVSTDPRNEFQRDYHRIIGSASFRRLQDKTQVFPLDRGDFVRTRLTHSLEVSSFAKSLGQMIFRNILQYGRDKDLTADDIEKICSVLECAGLIHDIGNPPFGHFGEDYVRDWFGKNLHRLEFRGKRIDEILSEQMLCDLYHFEGNAQALRLLTKLHFLVDGNGMNLTYTLLNTIIKYPVPSTGINKKSGNIKDKKMGYYYADKDIFEDIVNSTGAVNCRHPLAFILEAADDIAYKTADIEDAVKKGFVRYDQLIYDLKDMYAEKCADDGEREEFSKAVGKLEDYYRQAKEKQVSSPEQNAVQRWIIYVQGALLRCAAYGFTSNYKDIMEGSFPKELLAASHGNVLAYALGDIASRYVFQSKEIYKLEIAAGEIYEFLLSKLTRAAILYDTDIESSAIEQRIMKLVSENYIRAYKVHSKDKNDAEKLYLRLMLVTDFICGMTDGYAQKLYRELSGIE